MSPPFPTAFQNADNIVLQVDGSMLMKNAYERSYRIGVDESDLSDMEDEGAETTAASHLKDPEVLHYPGPLFPPGSTSVAPSLSPHMPLSESVPVAT